MVRNRYDETWHRLREWTKGQAPSERLAAQILIHQNFTDIDPSHPLGGKDGGKDAIAYKDGIRFAMAAYFPRGQQKIGAIRTKFEGDLDGARASSAGGIAFVTNQELTLGEREDLRLLAAPTVAELYHLERIAAILDVPSMAKVREQFLDITADDPPLIQLGGQGGIGPGAGGGGGAALGGGTGGSGGPGGNINIHGAPGDAPGAGGGGVGAIGEGAVGGEGGGGGELISVVLGPDAIGPDTGFHHMEIQVGKGGVGGPGEDSIVNLCDENGNVLQSIVAKGGKAGAPPQVPPPGRLPTAEDLQAGLRVGGILAAEFIRGKEGLWTIVDAGWDWVQPDVYPFRIVLPLLVEIETGTIDPGTILYLKLRVLNPNDFQVLEQQQILVVSDLPVRRSRFVVTLDFSGTQPGLWRVQVLGGTSVMGEFPIEVRAPASASG